jgi:mono/diheme cytochrome c family protein
MLIRKSALVIVLSIAAAACGSADDTGQPPASAPATGTPATPATPAPAAAAVVPEGATAEMVAQGGQLFTGAGNCQACHGADARGTPLAPNLRDQEWLNSDGSFEGIQTVIRTGVSNPVRYPAAMPPMGGVRLTDDQVAALAAYVYSISHGG